MKIQINTFLPGVLGFIVATLLFCLPGEEFPEAGWLESIQLDKLVHIGLFFVLVVLWCLPTRKYIPDQIRLKRIYLWITIGFILYGVVIEFMQRDLIPHRSFDVFDIIADSIGCILGLVVVRRIYI